MNIVNRLPLKKLRLLKTLKKTLNNIDYNYCPEKKIIRRILKLISGRGPYLDLTPTNLQGNL